MIPYESKVVCYITCLRTLMTVEVPPHIMTLVNQNYLNVKLTKVSFGF